MPVEEILDQLAVLDAGFGHQSVGMACYLDQRTCSLTS
jgi:hypothetical protein